MTSQKAGHPGIPDDQPEVGHRSTQDQRNEAQTPEHKNKIGIDNCVKSTDLIQGVLIYYTLI